MSALPLEGAANARDLGGGVLRSDNLQDLTPADVALLVEELGLRTVIDLRTPEEVAGEGPAPLDARPEVTVLRRSLHPETGGRTDADAQTVAPPGGPGAAEAEGEPLMVAAYLAYLRHRPDSIADAVRVIARPARDGAVLVHCAAGMDRTGVVIALALDAAGRPREEVVADYAATAENIEGIAARLKAAPSYAAELEGIDPSELAPRPETMRRFLAVVDERHGGGAGWLGAQGLTGDELTALRERLAGA